MIINYAKKSSSEVCDTKFKFSLPEILRKKINDENLWERLKSEDNEICFKRKYVSCSLNESGTRKVIVIVDSLASSLLFDLKERLVERNMHFVSMVQWAFPNMSLVRQLVGDSNSCIRAEAVQGYVHEMNKLKNAIIIIGGRESIEGDSLKSIQAVLRLAVHNEIILVYPIPSVEYNTLEEMIKLYKNNKFSFDDDVAGKVFEISWSEYKSQIKPEMEQLDKIQSRNVYRVNPQSLYCNEVTDSCVFKDSNDVFSLDGTHPSFKSSQMINELIIQKIQEIELNI